MTTSRGNCLYQAGSERCSAAPPTPGILTSRNTTSNVYGIATREKRRNAGARLPDVQVKTGAGQNLPHDLSETFESSTSRTCIGVRCASQASRQGLRLILGASEWLGQKLVSVELARQVYAAPVGGARHQSDKVLFPAMRAA